MNLTAYKEFVRMFGGFSYIYKNEPKLIISTGETTDNFVENIQQGISSCRVFEFDERIKKLLALTDPPNKNDAVHLPFPYIFLDVSFTKEELANLGIPIKAEKITGMLVTMGNLIVRNSQISNPVEQHVKLETKPVGRALRITCLSTQPNGEFWFDTFNKNIDLDKDSPVNFNIIENPTTDKKARDFSHRFIMAFLNFLYNPEIEYVEHLRGEKNQQRKLKNNQLPLPSTTAITVNGKLKEYIDMIDAHGHFDSKYSHRFWVRGFFRRLRSDRYKEKKTIWIAPFVKGKGVLIEKLYEVR